MKGKVENGQLLHIETPSYSGLAGFEDRNGVIRAAFIPTSAPAVGDKLTVEGVGEFTIARLEYGTFNERRRIATLTEVKP